MTFEGYDVSAWLCMLLSEILRGMKLVPDVSLPFRVLALTDAASLVDLVKGHRNTGRERRLLSTLRVSLRSLS